VDPELRRIAEAAKGFMPPDEGLALYEAALEVDRPLLEIGTYCGKSAVYLGAAARERGTVLFTIDHHRGSEEMQSGWEHHDVSTVDSSGRIDSFPFFRRTIEEAGLDDAVIAMVGDSVTIAKHWSTRLGLLFIDGAHSPDPAMADYEAWTPHLDGILAIHDVFADPSEGGQGPYLVYERAQRDGFAEIGVRGSLRILRR
jgi:predicted O-methyltransferase YrrM